MHGFLKFNHFITLVFVSAFLLFSPRIFADVTVGHTFAVSPLKIEYISQKPNVSLLNITAIVQDDEDFLWLGSTNGLMRFDGQSFKQFKTDPSQANSLPHNFIRSIFIDSKQRLWIGTINGLARYNKYQETFSRFDSNGLADKKIWTIFEDTQHRIWVSTQLGVHIYNEQTGRFELVSIIQNDQEFSPPEIKHIYQDSAGTIWLGSYYGPSYLIQEKYITSAKPINSNLSNIDIPQEGIHQVIDVNEDTQLIVTAKNIYQRIDGKIISLLALEKSNKTRFNHVEIDPDGNFWVASSSGVKLYHLVNRQFKLIQSVVVDQEVYHVFRDDNDTMWLAGHTRGLGRYQRNKDYFKLLSTQDNVLTDRTVWSIKEDSTQHVWTAGNDAKLTRMLLKDSSFTHFNTGIVGLKSLGFDHRGYLYVASDFGVFRFDPRATDFIGSKITVSTKETAYAAVVNDSLFIGVWDEGLFEISLKANDNYLERAVLYNNNPIPYISTLNSDPEHLYIGTISGLLKLDLTNRTLDLIQALNDQRVSFISLTANNIFVSTASAGVYQFDRKLENIERYIKSDLFNNSAVYSVLSDHHGNIWLSTDNGILCIEPLGVVHFFDRSNGLQGSDFNDTSALLSSDGTLLFGGVSGLNYLKITDKKKQHTNFKLKFTHFNLFNSPVVIGPDSNGFNRLPQSIIFSDKVSLNYNDYPFELSFKLINHPQSDQVHYRYRIPGVDKGWLPAQARSSAIYTYLSFGNYQLEVEAFIMGNKESVATVKIDIEILPPIWMSPWALICYFMVLFIITTVVIRVVIQRRASAIALEESAERLKLSLWGSGDKMWDWNITDNMMYRTQQWQTFDYEGFTDRSLNKIHPDDRERTKALLESHLNGDSQYFEANYRIRRKDDNSQWVWILDRAKVVEHAVDGKPSRMTGTIRDITKLKDTELKLSLQAEAIENISDGIYILDLDFNIVEANKAFEIITGYQRLAVLGNSKIFDSYQPKMADLIRAKLNKGQIWSGELKAVRPNKDYYYMQLSINIIFDSVGKASHYVAAFSDITNRKATETELRNLSNVDTLTQLPNRSYFQYAHRNLIRRNHPHALLTLDIDNFKKINDSMGHDEGDKLLCLIAQRIDIQIQCQHLLCRLGSDEFAILLEDIDQISTITQVIYEIEVAMQEPFILNNEMLVMSCSVGVAQFPTDGKSTENMLQSADTAMYHAKSDSGFSYKFYSASMNESAIRRLKIEGLIRQALKNDWFEVYYQPKYNTLSGQIMGMEALVRLIHPELGMISPNEFIPVAEDTGLVIEIGEIVLRKACFATQQWRKSGLFNGRVAVNLAAKQFAQVDLVQRITRILEYTQLPVANLELEITESTVIENPELAIMTMQSLTDIGISLALDDFGTGYSSLSYLKRFPIHTLKIDKAFIDDLTIEHGERHMVASIISIAHNMGLSVVAEGVEKEEQLHILKQLSCETIQGYIFSRPLSEKCFLTLLEQQLIKTL